MQNPTEITIRRQLTDYLIGKQSLDDFYGWLTVAMWDIHKREPRRVQKLVYEIKLLIAEFTNGDWSEQEVRNLLRPIAITYEL